jgi:hypothetical protein
MLTKQEERLIRNRLPTRIIIFLVWQCRYMKGNAGCEHKSCGFSPFLEAKLEQGRTKTIRGKEVTLGFDFIFQLHRSGFLEHCHIWGPVMNHLWPNEIFEEAHQTFKKYNLRESSRKCDLAVAWRQRRFKIPGIESAIITMMANSDGLTILQ